jgi:hypothetical protein
MSHMAIRPTIVNTKPIEPRIRACFMGLLGASRAVK